MLALTSDRAVGPWLRGRLHIAHVRPRTDLCTALDVLEAVLTDAPIDALRQRRRALDVAVAVAQARTGTVDRDAWGTAPEQQAEQARLMGGPGG